MGNDGFIETQNYCSENQEISIKNRNTQQELYYLMKLQTNLFEVDLNFHSQLHLDI